MTDRWPYVWQWNKWPAGEGWRPGMRRGMRCRVLVRGRRMNSALVEFEDGYRCVTSRQGLRRV